MCAPKIKFKVKIISCSCIIGLTLLVFYFGGAILHLIDLKYRNYTVSQPLTREQFISGLKHITSMGIRNKSFKTSSRSVPDVILQYGMPRTATTLQFQILCLMTAFMHEDEMQNIGCTFNKKETKKYNVIKTHDFSYFFWKTNLSTNTWVFMTNSSTLSKKQTAKIKREKRKIEAKHFRIPLVADIDLVSKQGYLIAHEYQAIFGMSHEKMKHIVEYLKYWDILRVCCGVQMSAFWRNHLFTKTRSSNLQHNTTGKPACDLYNIGEIEKQLIKTYAYKKFAPFIDAIGKLSIVDGKLDGNYCEQCNKNIAYLRLKFNEKCKQKVKSYFKTIIMNKTKINE